MQVKDTRPKTPTTTAEIFCLLLIHCLYRETMPCETKLTENFCVAIVEKKIFSFVFLDPSRTQMMCTQNNVIHIRPDGMNSASLHLMGNELSISRLNVLWLPNKNEINRNSKMKNPETQPLE